MFHLKHDVQIHLKKEKEVFQFVRLFLFTFILSAVLMGLPDYIWNMHLYRISLIVVPWLIAVPSIVYCIKQIEKLIHEFVHFVSVFVRAVPVIDFLQGFHQFGLSVQA